MAETNRLHFNEEASTYDSKHGKFNERLTEEIQARLDWIGVDWASDDEDEDEDDDDDGNEEAGPKPIQSRREALAPYTTQSVGIDISENMVAAYNSRAEIQGLTRDEMHAIVGDLAAADGPQPSDLFADSRFFGFDLATVGGGLHHFADPELAADRLVERLRPGGVLLVWDFLPHGPHHGLNAHAVLHHGLSEERVRKMFEHAGAGKGFSLEVLGSGLMPGHYAQEGKELMKRQIFLARGEKAA
ncbi:S-adenosyl-L-methionine-dependent methyltransferase [Daldinia decipiens]|uniref:S-adenosyl-L-methionine-dependent methyltransferase n=1 Tax=Daldinia decipiens TaxID=326647 RepID=UPI0020C22391|nr:S-adenosyl-L-methionine-dependent methyltransferase [Daldinia decipiens]KAI1662492.1 S-adenosyl-L-methionine-dependent methyltransferase [Daldinia decipiens]